MKNLIIIGAGGMGRTIFDMARECVGYEENYVIKGFLDDNLFALDTYSNYPPILSTIESYQIQEDDVFTCSIGGDGRKNVILKILESGGKFITLIHKSARIGTNVDIGKGNIIGVCTTIAADAKIGNYNLIQSYTIIGHDVKIEDWNRIDSYVMCVGGIYISNNVKIHTSAVLNHDVIINANACVGACSFVTRDVEENSTVFGNPARRLK